MIEMAATTDAWRFSRMLWNGIDILSTGTTDPGNTGESRPRGGHSSASRRRTGHETLGPIMTTHMRLAEGVSASWTALWKQALDRGWSRPLIHDQSLLAAAAARSISSQSGE